MRDYHSKMPSFESPGIKHQLREKVVSNGTRQVMAKHQVYFRHEKAHHAKSTAARSPVNCKFLHLQENIKGELGQTLNKRCKLQLRAYVNVESEASSGRTIVVYLNKSTETVESNRHVRFCA